MNNASTSNKKGKTQHHSFPKLKNIIVIATILVFMTAMAFTISLENIQKGPGALENDSVPVKVPGHQENEGLSLLEINCFVCHNPNSASHDEILAPPLAGVKKRYQMATNNREEFIAKMSAFVADPQESKALMKGPVNRFGVMPKPNVTPENIKKIVEYIYDNPIEEPSWFAEHHEKMNKH